MRRVALTSTVLIVFSMIATVEAQAGLLLRPPADESRHRRSG